MSLDCSVLLAVINKMPRLFGFTPTKSMLEAYKNTKKQEHVVHTENVIDITHNGPIIESRVMEIEIPTYTKTVKLPEMPSEIKNYTRIKRNVNLNPLSDE
jgi:hypothetical protein